MVTREVQMDPHVFQSVTKVVTKEFVWALIPANVKQDMGARTAQSFVSLELGDQIALSNVHVRMERPVIQSQESAHAPLDG